MNKIKNLIRYFKSEEWKKDSGKEPWFTKPLKIGIYSIQGIESHEIPLRSSALTFYTVMSLVPIVALIFAILKGFGFEEDLTNFLYSRFADYKQVLDILLGFVTQMLAKTKGGIIAAVGVVVLLWSVMKVFGNMENAFNNIWEVKNHRSLERKITDYIVVIFIAPILLVSAISLSTVVRNFLSFLQPEWLIDLLFGIVSWLIVCLIFIFIYWRMPYTKVRLLVAVTAGTLAGSVFFIFSLFYFFIQTKVSSFNAIYGTFAAIPLFLAWLQTSWQIVFIGAEISYVHQNINHYEYEKTVAGMDIVHTRKVLVAVMVSVARNFLKQKGPVSISEIAAELKFPEKTIRQMLDRLKRAGLVVPVKNEEKNMPLSYMPARDIHSLRICHVVDAVENYIPEPNLDKLPEMQRISRLMDDMWGNNIQGNCNVFLKDMI